MTAPTDSADPPTPAVSPLRFATAVFLDVCCTGCPGVSWTATTLADLAPTPTPARPPEDRLAS